MIEDAATRSLVCCYRILRLGTGPEVEASYSAQFFDLSRLYHVEYPLIEVGRFCIRRGVSHPDIPRLAWAALVKITDRYHAGMLFGCTSFAGGDAQKYRAAFAYLEQNHLAPAHLRPGVKAPDIVRFDKLFAREKTDLSRVMKEMPPLLRSYLALGGWISDHAVVDADLETLHVFTGVEIAAIPETRIRLLRRDSFSDLNMLL